MLSLIDPTPIAPGYGNVYQSGVMAAESWDRKGLIVSMSGNTTLRGPCLWISMPDTIEDTLPDDVLLEMVETVIIYLKRGDDVLIHCVEGKYRSTYLDVAVHMHGLKMSCDQALGYVQNRHPIAELRYGTRTQLKRLEDKLKGDL